MISASAATLVLALTLLVAPASAQPIATAGAGTYYESLPPSAQRPKNNANQPVYPAVTQAFVGPPSTNDWWSSLIFRRSSTIRYGADLHAHPLVFRGGAPGLQIAMNAGPSVSDRRYRYGFFDGIPLRAGLAGLNAPDMRVDSYGDWHVVAEWRDGPRVLRATMAHGAPFVYLEASGANATVELLGGTVVVADTGNTLFVSHAGTTYGIFAAPGVDWTVSGSLATADVSGSGGFSVACLPDNDPATRALFEAHAGAFLTGTEVSWTYRPDLGVVETDFTLRTQPRWGNQTAPLTALYRHQWLHTTATPVAASFPSPRGEMKLYANSTLTVRTPVQPIIPTLAPTSGLTQAELFDLVNLELSTLTSQLPQDTYWAGKALGRLAQLALLADQAGHTNARNAFLNVIKGDLADWFTVGNGTGSHFAYDPNWATLLGTPGSFNLAAEMNDHHFHYGYFVMAAAVVAMFDEDWASDTGFGPMVELLIRDANSWDPADTLFPRLRSFDAFAGHAWASGHANFLAGNNQESSSESMNFAAACVLWGEVTGDTEIRDLGLFLHATEAQAVQQYWFDADQTVFPSTMSRPQAGILWGDGIDYNTWWTTSREEIHGINILPVTGGSLYLGARPDKLQRSWDLLLQANPGPPETWHSILYSQLALADPAAAAAFLDSGAPYSIEGGDSNARFVHWVRTLEAVGPLVPEVHADIPTVAVFEREGIRTYMAWNASGAPRTVSFSDGFEMTLAPGELASAARPTPGGCAADIAPPFGVLSYADITEFLRAFTQQDPAADLAPPFGAFTISDATAFLTSFNAGCP